MGRRRYGPSLPAPIHWMAAKRIHELERYLDHRYGQFVPDDDAGREDLVILLNHVAKNRLDPRSKVLGTIRRWAPRMPETEAEALADKILKKPRKYKATTLGRLLRLTQEEQITLYIETIRPFDKTDADMEEDSKRRDREWQAANRAAKGSGRPRGRPKSKGVKPWETMGIAKSTYYRRKRKAEVGETQGETKNASTVLESYSYSDDAISVSPKSQPWIALGISRATYYRRKARETQQAADSHAPQARRREAPPPDDDVVDVVWSASLRAPPPIDHLARALARARYLRCLELGGTVQ
jgi:hypothetical protein